MGVPGSGKTLLLLERITKLIDSDTVKPENVYIVGLSARAAEVWRIMATQHAPHIAEDVNFGTFRDFAWQEVQKLQDKPYTLADNVLCRQLIRRTVEIERFPGGVFEAEPLLRAMKSAAKTPDQSHPHYNLFNTYQKLLESYNLLDANDIIRKHLIGMRSDILQPCPVRYIVVDNVQDATQIQLVWLREHMQAGSTLIMAGNDDLTCYNQEGALGIKGVEQLADLVSVKTFELQENFRTPVNIGPATNKIPRLLQQRQPKREGFVSKVKATVHTERSASIKEQEQKLIKRLKTYLPQHPKARVGVVTRNHYWANRFHQALHVGGISAANCARNLWENPAPKSLIALLYVLLNKADNEHLRLVLIGQGINRSLVNSFFTEGLQAADWLKNGAQLPSTVDASGESLRQFSTIRRKLLGYYQVLQSRKDVDAKEVFKAAVYDMLQQFNQRGQQDILLALHILLNIKGKLIDILPRMTETTLPDMRAQVVVAPVREVRNMQFDLLVIPHAEASLWPFKNYEVLPYDADAERRLFYLAITRAAGDVWVSFTDKISPFVAELQQNIK